MKSPGAIPGFFYAVTSCGKTQAVKENGDGG